MIRPIAAGHDNPVLRTRSTDVKKFDRDLLKFIKDLEDTLYAEDGLGIAAPQVGKNIRVFLAKLDFGAEQALVMPMINPNIIDISDEKMEGEEGCLSLPGVFGIVKRAKELIVQFKTLKNEDQTLRLDGLNARIIQHEMDHINGALFIDKMEREITPEERERRKKEHTS